MVQKFLSKYFTILTDIIIIYIIVYVYQLIFKRLTCLIFCRNLSEGMSDFCFSKASFLMDDIKLRERSWKLNFTK